uniref:Uncharacterized protein n=1 Tax=Anguilla anguilla TaxID=7936 RepID=A0A0E9P8Y8_ANGAN
MVLGGVMMPENCTNSLTMICRTQVI